MVHSPSERKPFLRLDKPRGLTSRFYDQLIEDLRERLHHTGPFLFWLARIGLATTAAVLLLHQVSLFEKQAPPDCSFSADVHVVVNFLRAAAVYHCIVVFLMFGGQALLLGFASSMQKKTLLSALFFQWTPHLIGLCLYIKTKHDRLCTIGWKRSVLGIQVIGDGARNLMNICNERLMEKKSNQ